MKKYAFTLLLLLTACSVWGQNSPTKPMISLRATVDHLRLRATPDKSAAVIAELPEHSQLLYLDETGGAFENVILRGVPHQARWYKVSPIGASTQIGWVTAAQWRCRRCICRKVSARLVYKKIF